MKRITKIDGVEFVPYKDYKAIKELLEIRTEELKYSAGLINLIRMLIFNTYLSDQDKIELIGEMVDKYEKIMDE